MPTNPVPGETYTVQSGDTLTRIAIAAYGSPDWQKIYRANHLRLGNPDKIFPGDELFIPLQEDIRKAETEARIKRAAGKPKMSITVVIDGMEIKTVSGRFGYSIDDMTRLWNCTIPWIPGKNPRLDKATARGSFAEGELYLGPELVGIGTLYERITTATADSSTRQLNFFSNTADLVDSTLFPSYGQIDKSTLQQIAEIVLGEAGFLYEFIDPPGPEFDSVQRTAAEKVAAYFQRLAAQRGLFVSTDEQGRVIFQKLKTDGQPVMHIEYGSTRNNTEYKAGFNDRLRFGTYVGTMAADDGTHADSTIKDPTVRGARQILFNAPDCNAETVKSATEWFVLKSQLEAMSFPVNVPGFWDDHGDLLKPNTKVTLKAPILDVPETQPFIIRSIEMGWSPTEIGTQLNLIPPLVLEGGKLMIGAK